MRVDRPAVFSVFSVLFLCVLCVALPCFSAELFEDKVVARGKNLVIKESDLDEAFVGHKAAAAALGQRVPGVLDDSLKARILEKMIATRLMLARATPADRDEGKRTADRMIADGKEKAVASQTTTCRSYAAFGSCRLRASTRTRPDTSAG